MYRLVTEDGNKVGKAFDFDRVFGIGSIAGEVDNLPLGETLYWINA